MTPPMTAIAPTFASDLLQIVESSSRCREGWTPEMGGEPPSIVLIRRGAFAVKGLVEVVADPLIALVYDGAHGYRTNHFAPGGNERTRLIFTEEVLLEALGQIRPCVASNPAIHLRHLRLLAEARAEPENRLAVEETGVELLAELAAANPHGFQMPVITSAVRRRIAMARAHMAAAPQQDHRLAELAAIAGCSPYHFARLFRTATGDSVRGYRLRLRLAMAAARLADGAEDLAAVAVDTGFAHHSHMTSAFQRLLGRSPSRVRAELGQGGTFLKADRRRAA